MIAIVCSKCADIERSLVTAVQSSSRTSTSGAPAFTMGSTAMTRPVLTRFPRRRLPEIRDLRVLVHLPAGAVADELRGRPNSPAIPHSSAPRGRYRRAGCRPGTARSPHRAPRARCRPAAASLGATLPTRTVRAVSAQNPCLKMPKSMPMMSPSSSTSVLRRDAVHDHLVDRRTQHGRIAVVAEERADDLVLVDAAARDLIELPGRRRRASRRRRSRRGSRPQPRPHRASVELGSALQCSTRSLETRSSAGEPRRDRGSAGPWVPRSLRSCA